MAILVKPCISTLYVTIGNISPLNCHGHCTACIVAKFPFFLLCINLNWKWDQKCTDQQKIFFQVTRQICRSPTLPFQDCIGSGHSGEESTSLTFQSRDRDGCSKRWRWTRRGLRNLGWDRTKGHFSGYQLPSTCPLLQLVPPGQQKKLKHFLIISCWRKSTWL